MTPSRKTQKKIKYGQILQIYKLVVEAFETLNLGFISLDNVINKLKKQHSIQELPSKQKSNTHPESLSPLEI